MIVVENSVNTFKEEVITLDRLLIVNEVHFQTFTQRPFFKMIQSGVLNQDEKKRTAFFNYMQIFADYFQTMIQMRQATCSDDRFYPTFLKHFLDELGHDNLFRQRDEIQNVWDPILVAVMTWFVHKMQVLDNVEKTVVMHLVLEKGGDYYHSIGNQTLTQHMASSYYAAHEELDEGHASMAMNLLSGYPKFVYHRLNHLLRESWLMLYAMVDRVHECVMRQ